LATKKDLEPLATKNDLLQLETVIAKSFEEIETNFGHRISRLENEVGFETQPIH
jgi:hypothetical protein